MSGLITAGVDARLVNKLVDLVGGDTGSDHLTGAKKDFGRRRTGAPHGGEFVGGAGKRRDRRAGVAGDRIRGRAMTAGTRRVGLSRPGCTGGSDGETSAAIRFFFFRLAIPQPTPWPAWNSSQEAADRLDDARRLVDSFDLDRNGDDGLHPTVDLLCIGQHGGTPNL